ncbi:BolA/IbaG family iron-sulfur metabolism protein [Haliangium ochraceum]|uniref:BolA family protein n=1 Tax=Haliangium ochraceum (strain DSM 14365 / JCM 11303 / SMP-2) TaxID=502025 RepID=D0LVG0_HALO1|nr:BolA family protein [Haliangium ochraceum]ACY17521.1 BolA family protein [Haliangium ochraceum DSM 14365]
MSVHLTTFQGSVSDAIRQAIQEKLEDADIEVDGGGGHFRISVRSAAFEGKNTLQRHRLVLGAIAPLMKGDSAPVHAVDSLETIPK